MRQVAFRAGRLALAALLLACLAGCATLTDGRAVRSTPLPAAAALPGIDAASVLEELRGHTFECSEPAPDPAVALVTYTCTTVSEDTDSTATATVTIEASPDGRRVYLVNGRLALRTGEPDDDLAVGLCGNLLGSLPFGEPALPDLVAWVRANVESGGSGQFGSLSIAMSGPPSDRKCRYAER